MKIAIVDVDLTSARPLAARTRGLKSKYTLMVSLIAYDLSTVSDISRSFRFAINSPRRL